MFFVNCSYKILFMQHFNIFHNLSQQEKKQLVRFPVYLSLLAASKDYSLDRHEKNIAVKLTHIKTFACDPVLAEYYATVDQDFEAAVAEISEHLPREKQAREWAIKKELSKLDGILHKLDREYAATMYRSLRSYKEQISRAHRNVLEYFLFPLPINGLTD
jgi:hypothetical protein